MIIGLTGTLAAGKGTIVDYLKIKGFKHYSVTEYLIEEIKQRGLEINRDSMVFVANDLREKYGSSFLAEKLYETAKINGGDSIIESLRTPGEIISLKNKKDFYLFSIDANQRLRYERAFERKGEKDHITFEEFVSNEKREWENTDPVKQNLKQCIEMADYNFMNNGCIEELEEKIEVVLKKIVSNEKNIFSGRENCISWDEYFMGISVLSAKRSKDPSTQVGACIIDEDKKIVGTGYNGSPRGIDDKDFPWKREGDFLETKYAYVCHAELNAILNSTKESLKNCTMYVALFPCNECAKAIIQSGIKKVVYLSDKYFDTPASIASRRILTMAGIELVELKPQNKKIELNFD
jgi:dCMP deaminase